MTRNDSFSDFGCPNEGTLTLMMFVVNFMTFTEGRRVMSTDLGSGPLFRYVV